MKYTVLEMVQDILSAMDSDNVNSINDTIEAEQVARIIKTCYNDIKSTIEIPDEYELMQLDASGDASKPVVMQIPAAFSNIEWIRYNKKGNGSSGSSSGSWTSPDGVTVYYGPSEANFGSAATGETHQQFKDIVYLPREKFLDIVQMFDSNDVKTVTYSVDGVSLLAKNDKQPDYWTILDNRTIVFDSYDASVDTTLQAAKTMAYGKKVSSFTLSDNWTIDLDDKYTSLLYNEAESAAFFKLKQMANPIAEKKARQAKIKIQKSKKAAPYGEPAIDDNPDYGRHYKPSTYSKGYYR